MKNSFKRIKALTVRNVKEIVREPISLIFLYALPVVMLVLFYFLFSGLTDQFKMQYLAPGMIPFANTFLTLFLGILIASDRSSSFIIRLYTTEIKPYEFILSYAFAVIPVGLSQSVLVLLIGGIIDFSFFSPYMLLGIVFSLPVQLLFIAFGILFGSLCNEKAVGGISSIVITGQSVLSGMWFPLEGMSQGFITLLNVLPFRSATILMQNVIEGSFSFDGVAKPLLILLAYAVVLMIISIICYRKKMEK